jgi:hypothetical protein
MVSVKVEETQRRQKENPCPNPAPFKVGKGFKQVGQSKAKQEEWNEKGPRARKEKQAVGHHRAGGPNPIMGCLVGREAVNGKVLPIK